MKSNKRTRERKPLYSRASSKVPLTFYRSGQEKRASPKSPFEAIASEKKAGVKTVFNRVLDFVIVVAIIFGLVYSLVVAPRPQVEVSSEIYRSNKVYEDAAIREFEQLKNRTKATLDEQEIIRSLQKQFPEIINANVELPLFSQVPKVHINIAKPSFTLSSNGDLYIVNSQGVAVAKDTDFPSIKDLPVVADQTDFEVSAGKQVLSESSVDFINTLIAQCKQAGVPISSLTLPVLAQELDLYTSDKPYYVKFYLGGDPAVQTGQFLASRNQFNRDNITPLQYLDVRVSGKIFYK